MSNDPYVVLQLPRNATDDQIKQQYYILAMRYHPDKLTIEESEDKRKQGDETFKAINHVCKCYAYALLMKSQGGGGGVLNNAT